ncbi:hypothetical protein EI94DRAFT_1821020 [Lactarius quietus]|nr:hypothetical protein EI94DRAFT_1821020 [Lactarius quietus]
MGNNSTSPNPATQMGATHPVELQRPLPEIDAQRDGITSISDLCLTNSVSPMGTTKPHRPLPNINFRVLIIGRANAGKTSILQRVCDTTDSLVVWRRGKEIQLTPTMDRGEHSIQDELVFSNHAGYIFHDSCGFEAGSNEELGIVQGFIRRMSGERRLPDRLHAIWYCVPMDNQRPELDLKFFSNICPDQNVPVIAVFTKYDQFLRNVKIDLEDYGNPDDNTTSNVAEKLFEEHYLRHLGDGAKFVRLEKTHKPETRCRALLEETVEALNEDVVALMLLAVQREDLELSINMAMKRWVIYTKY